MGEILLTRPSNLGLMVYVSVAIILLFVGFICVGEYTRKERVNGKILPSRGTARVYSPVAGRIVEKLVHEGQFVKRGQTLYVISTEQITSRGSIQHGVEMQIAQKKAMLQAALRAQEEIQAENEKSVQRKLVDLADQQQIIEKEIGLQKERIALSKAAIGRFAELSRAKFISAAQLSAQQENHLDQIGRLMSLERTQQSLRAEMRSSASTLKNAALTAQTQRANIKREIAQLEQDAYVNEAQRQIVITSVRDGWATAVLGEEGQTVSPATPLMSVLPRDGQLEAHLYVPSKAIGFLRRGQIVKLRYDAFPYQKFGQHSGHIENISNVALAPGELQLLGMPPEMLYRVKVKLDEPSITAYGKKYPLQEGMKFEADILLDTRKLFEWLLDPLYSITGKL